MPLIPADEGLATLLRKAEDCIEEKDYESAITYLNEVIQRPDAGLYRVGKTRRFLPIRSEANQLLSRMPDDGLDLYRKLYDPQANQLYIEARQGGNLALLRDVADRYQNTSCGPVALESLAELSFDRGLFAQSAWCWSQVLDQQEKGQTKPMQMVKLALAAHLSSQDTLFDRALKMLKSHPKATGRIGRAEVNLLQYVIQTRKEFTPTDAMAGRTTKGWPGLWAMPGQIGVMDPVDVVLSPRWAANLGSIDPQKDYFLDKVIAGAPQLHSGLKRKGVSARVHLEKGHVLLTYNQRNRKSKSILPAMLHPIVVGDLLVFRNDEGVSAYDAVTGKLAWKTSELPLVGNRTKSDKRQYYGLYGQPIMDNGRYTLGLGDGKVYAVGRFRPWSARRYYRQRGKSSGLDDNSCLSAVGLSAQGNLLWTIGRNMEGGEPLGNDNLLQDGKYLSAPAYAKKRLFVMMLHMQTYWLACIDSGTGNLIWKARTAQTPPQTGQGYHNRDYLLGMGTMPSLANGRVYVTNNAGVIACFDQKNGQPVWAYQYNSTTPGNLRSNAYRYIPKAIAGVNPIVIHQGRVIALPADSKEVICLSAEDGRQLWTTSRRDLVHLTGIDDSRVVISGTYELKQAQSLAVLSTKNGRQLSAPQRAVGIHGRPAVTADAIYASSMGHLLRIDLKDYAVATIGPADPSALLGNLVSVNGKLFAANPFGISAYMAVRPDMAKPAGQAGHADPGHPQRRP